ncbi:MAG: PEGA domain-containing protein [Planctomycetota bacterium]|jgi:tetratricopeptide (TPR) repeat protein|nr:PEGA domain-containing protein [Planctomycetota bacterium]
MKAEIKIIAGREAGQVFTVSQGDSLTIGRSLDNGISILDEKSSRCHCKVEHDGDGILLVDLNSLNGTYLNGRSIARRHLSHGDRFKAGSSHFEILFDGKPAPVRGLLLLLLPLTLPFKALKIIPAILGSQFVTRLMPVAATASVILAAWSIGSTWLAGKSTVSVHSSPVSAMVFIDGEYAGQTPVEGIELERGMHLVKVQKHGFEIFKETVDLGMKSHAINAALPPLPTGDLEVASKPPGAEIYLDGEYQGKAPKTLKNLEMGEHVLRLVLSEHLSIQEKIMVSSTELTRTSYELKEEMVQFYEDHLSREPNDASALSDLAHLHILAGRFDRAIESLESAYVAVNEGADTSDYSRRLDQEVQKAYRVDHYDYGDYNDVAKFRTMLEEMLERVVERFPKQENQKRLIGFYQQAGRADKITALYAKLYEKFPNVWDNAKNYGSSLLNAGNYAEAKRVFDKARRSSGHWEVHYYYGVACLNSNPKSATAREEAKESLEKALRGCTEPRDRAKVNSYLRRVNRGN